MRPRETLKWVVPAMLSLSLSACRAEEGRLSAVPFTAVKVTDEFWGKRIETNRTVTLPDNFKKCEDTARIRNFAVAGGLEKGKFEGIHFNDSDVFKVIEGASYSLSLHPDPKLDEYLDGVIAKIAAAQEDDGYLYTCRTIDPKNPPKAAGPERWSNLAASHELYNVGHMYEAAVAHFQATGKRTFLDVAIKNADLVCKVFGPGAGQIVAVPGHEEIEIGLVKLYRATGDRKYLDQAKFFIDMRGRADKRKLYGPYAQDHVPVVEQTEPIGHAVRAGYLYCGMTDVAALTDDAAYMTAIDRIWENVVSRRLYLTGGIGARHAGEAFGDDYELPNASAYNETCAAIANALWNQRLFLLHGDSKYVDVLERVIYNGFLSGISMEGNSYFYPNPLAVEGKRKYVRQAWFGCSCCPVNVVRFIPSIPGYVYAQAGEALYVNLYVGSTATIPVAGGVKLTQETRYPWDGQVKITVEPRAGATFDLLLRIPGWARGEAAPGDLYAFADPAGQAASLKVNGQDVPLPALEKGYARLRRAWKVGDTVELNLPMPIRRVHANPKVKDDAGRAATQRGPIVYCVEGVDNGGQVQNLLLPPEAKLSAEHRADLLGGVTVITGKASARAADGKVAPADLTAIPYYAWAHREPGQMAVWLPENPDLVPKPAFTSAVKVTASFCHANDDLDALNDQILPKKSDDHGVPRMTWWAHKGTAEWVQYDFPAPAKVDGVEVYWFDDTGRGECRVPESWKVLYKDGEKWQPVQASGPCGVARNKFNQVSFAPVTTSALRLEVKLQPKVSGGILEWRVNQVK